MADNFFSGGFKKYSKKIYIFMGQNCCTDNDSVKPDDQRKSYQTPKTFDPKTAQNFYPGKISPNFNQNENVDKLEEEVLKFKKMGQDICKVNCDSENVTSDLANKFDHENICK